ncbi:ABC-F family ATP-binding cassette domain-containing protein [Legionella sp. W05-934-2]|uniref:ABC-F family ATP-binding cassette domain-containing protein n=1 Tax=Legionella sp. W05-934-2 TaxID=1198649 RepID=UPI0034633B47
MLNLTNLTLMQGNKILIKKSSISLFEKQKVGLVGKNGSGKSSLFSLILGQLHPEEGECLLNNNLRISHLAQHVPDSEEPAIDYVLGGDVDYQALMHELKEAEHLGDADKMVACHNRLSETDGYAKPAQAAAILAGLGVANERQTEAVKAFSGGWRMRLNLARCLMKPAELMLLDEPTNHLDLEAIYWLEKWLKQSPATIIIISHDRDFLDAFTSHTLHIEHQQLTLYSGNYSQFELIRAEKLALQQATYEKQQAKVAHLMSFVDRFRYKASKAKQAQSRLKAIERINLIAQAQVDSNFSFQFYPCDRVSSPMLQSEELDAGYQKGEPVLQKVNLTINPGDRIALLGPNGMGKSTLIKTLTQRIAPLAGQIHRAKHLNIAYYAQHQLEELDVHQSPMAQIQALSPEVSEQEIRNFLGGFGFQGDNALTTIEHFSGGEKARLALAKLVWQKPNLLLLDEPTNHLDLDMRAAVTLALQSFEGAMILISHDRHLLRNSVDQFYLIYNNRVSAFDGDLDDYYQWLSQLQTSLNSTTKKADSSQLFKQKKQLTNRVDKLERQITELQQEHLTIENDLSDLTLYEAGNAHKLSSLQDKAHLIKSQLSQMEQDWLEAIENLEALNEER